MCVCPIRTLYRAMAAADSGGAEVREEVLPAALGSAVGMARRRRQVSAPPALPSPPSSSSLPPCLHAARDAALLSVKNAAAVAMLVIVEDVEAHAYVCGVGTGEGDVLASSFPSPVHRLRILCRRTLGMPHSRRGVDNKIAFLKKNCFRLFVME